MKKALAILLVCLLCIGLAACSGSSDNKKDGADTAGTKLVRIVRTTYQNGSEVKTVSDCKISGEVITFTANSENSTTVSEYEYVPDAPVHRVRNAFLDIDSPGTFDALGFVGNRISDFSYYSGEDGSPNSQGNRYEYDGNTMKNTYYEDDAVVKTEITEFEAHGIETKFSVFEADGSPYSEGECICEYDDAGKVIKVTKGNSRARNGNARKEYENGDIVEYEYDSAGNMTKARRTNRSEDGEMNLFAETENEYDAENRIVKKQVRIFGIEYYLLYEYKYDASGRLTAVTASDKNGEIQEKTEFIYA